MSNKKRKRHHEIVKGNKHLFEEGDLVTWRYRHYLNSTVYTTRYKTGMFVRYINSSFNDGFARGTLIRYAYVKFPDNKNNSKVPIKDLFINI